MALIPRVARELRAAGAAYEVIDTVAVPLLRRCRGQRQRLFGALAAIGPGGAAIRSGITAASCSWPSRPRAWSLALSWPRPTPRSGGSPTRCWAGGPTPHAGPLQVADLPSPRRPNGRPYVGPTGPRWPPQGAGAPGRGGYLADNGFWGQWWQQHWHDDYGAALTHAQGLSGPAGGPRPVASTAAGVRSSRPSTAI